jgi:hypothetical protein
MSIAIKIIRIGNKPYEIALMIQFEIEYPDVFSLLIILYRQYTCLKYMILIIKYCIILMRNDYYKYSTTLNIILNLIH